MATLVSTAQVRTDADAATRTSVPRNSHGHHGARRFPSPKKSEKGDKGDAPAPKETRDRHGNRTLSRSEGHIAPNGKTIMKARETKSAVKTGKPVSSVVTSSSTPLNRKPLQGRKAPQTSVLVQAIEEGRSNRSSVSRSPTAHELLGPNAPKTLRATTLETPPAMPVSPLHEDLTEQGALGRWTPMHVLRTPLVRAITEESVISDSPRLIRRHFLNSKEQIVLLAAAP